MSVKVIKSRIQAAISQIREAQVEWKVTPEHRKYIEIAELMLKVDAMMIQLKVLEMNAEDTLRKVLKREGKRI